MFEPALARSHHYCHYLFLASVALLDWPSPYSDVVDAIHLARAHWQPRPFVYHEKKGQNEQKAINSLLNSTFLGLRHTNEKFFPKDNSCCP